jgi:hypothetical protein
MNVFVPRNSKTSKLPVDLCTWRLLNEWTKGTYDLQFKVKLSGVVTIIQDYTLGVQNIHGL